MLLPTILFAAAICAPVIIDSAQDQYDLLMETKKLTISVPSNPTTGYLWELSPKHLSYLVLSKQEYHPPKSKAFGAGGTQYFEFMAVANQEFNENIELILKRAWEAESARTVTLRVRYIA